MSTTIRRWQEPIGYHKNYQSYKHHRTVVEVFYRDAPIFILPIWKH
jgi:hypothetical protein